MARSKITAPVTDLVTDSGATLWSVIQGEQLEFPVILNFITDALSPNYTFEAAVIEADNEIGQTSAPTAVKSGGILSTLIVRKPTYAGIWSNASTYDMEDVCGYNGKYYKLLNGVDYLSATPPDADLNWEETQLNKIYIQFPKTLGSDWAVKPGPSYDVFGFFELRVTEPNNSVFVRTWKPVRGMLEISFSPTYSVGD